MSTEHRDQLLELVFANAPPAATRASSGQFDAAILSDITAGLVFASRPINAAGRQVGEKYHLGPRGTFMLSLIDRGVCYPKDLAVVLRIGRSLVTAEIIRLTEAGLISSEAGDDRRRTRLALTPVGQEVNLEVRARIIGFLEEALSGYDTAQIALFAQMLRRIGRVTQD